MRAAAAQVAELAAALGDDVVAMPDVTADADELVRAAAAGVAVVARCPATVAPALLEQLPDAVVLEQRVVEGHRLVRSAGPIETREAVVVVSGVAADALERALSECAVRVRDVAGRTREDLERANDELRRTNSRLTREWLGRHDAAAASLLGRHDLEVMALREELRRKEARIEELTEVAAHNDRMYQQERAWRDARRYHVVDWLWARAGILRRLLSRPR